MVISWRWARIWKCCSLFWREALRSTNIHIPSFLYSFLPSVVNFRYFSGRGLTTVPDSLCYITTVAFLLLFQNAFYLPAHFMTVIDPLHRYLILLWHLHGSRHFWMSSGSCALSFVVCKLKRQCEWLFVEPSSHLWSYVPLLSGGSRMVLISFLGRFSIITYFTFEMGSFMWFTIFPFFASRRIAVCFFSWPSPGAYWFFHIFLAFTDFTLRWLSSSTFWEIGHELFDILFLLFRVSLSEHPLLCFIVKLRRFGFAQWVDLTVQVAIDGLLQC